MKSKYFLLFLLLSFVKFSYAQIKWQNSQIDPDSLYFFGSNAIVPYETKTFLTYTSGGPSFGFSHFSIIDSLGNIIKDTIFTPPNTWGENSYGLFKLTSNKAVVVTYFTDQAGYAFYALTCFDQNGNFLWRTEGDTIDWAFQVASSNDTIFMYYNKVGKFYVDLYNDNGVLLNHMVASNAISSTNSILFLDKFKYKNGYIYVSGYEYFGTQDTKIYTKCVSINGSTLYEGSYSPTLYYDFITDIVAGDNQTVYFIGVSDIPLLGNIFNIGAFDSTGTLIWSDTTKNGVYSVSPENIHFKNNKLFAVNSGYNGYSLDEYEIGTGIKTNVFVADSMIGNYRMFIKDFGQNTILFGLLKGYNGMYREFIEYNISTQALDTIYTDTISPWVFSFMQTKDNTGFYYNQFNIVTYFEKTITTISENQASENTQLPYPNPFYDKLNLECKETDLINFFDYSGRLCLTSIKSELEKKLPQLPKGNYIVEILNASISKKFRLVKN